MCLYIDAEGHELGDLGEPANYKVALLDPESEKWLNAMNVEMQSMKDNEVWVLVELPPNGKIIGSKWLFKKKTDMNGNGHELGDLGEPANYKVALLDPESEKWLNAMNVEMQSMKDNEVWVLVELPPNGKTVGSKWLFKKKTDMDGNVHTYKARLVEKGYTLTPWIDYEETFSPVADIRAIRILKGIAAVSCYTDAGYLTDADDLKSHTGYVFVLNDGAVDWKSAKKIIFATSSAEAEYIAAFDASKEAVWVRKFIFRLGVVPTIEEPISMYCDNTVAIAIANESGITKGARHFRAKVHYLREVIEYDDIKLEKVHTDDNLADPFTKALAFSKHSKHTRNIGMLQASSLIIPMQEKLKLSKSQGASTPAELKRMQKCSICLGFELPPNGKTVGSKWLFKKKTDMDGNVHTYKARLVEKGYTLTPWIDYEETFSPVADIRDIRILKGIAAYYDYEIWQMDVKTTFLNGYLNEEVYKEKPKECNNLIATESRVSCYTDARYLTDADDLKSQTGYVLVLNGGGVDWKSAKKIIFATSSAEAEYIAAFYASKEAVW
nr:putative retrotransposon protein [Tanacetum cinerariifolium]